MLTREQKKKAIDVRNLRMHFFLIYDVCANILLHAMCCPFNFILYDGFGKCFPSFCLAKGVTFRQ